VITVNKCPKEVEDVFVIAEIGINHNGDIDTALKMIECAASAGADAVKFQTFNADMLVLAGARLANYQTRSGTDAGDQLSLLKKVQLTYSEHQLLVGRAAECDVEFMSTAFDSPSLAFLVKEAGLKRLKIASGEITNGPFLLEHAKLGLPIILSTGMARLEEIDEALGVIGLGYVGRKDLQREEPKAAWQVPEVAEALREKVTLLQCTTQYPAPIDEANLDVLTLFSSRYGVRVGYSDHTIGNTAAVVAVSLGASVIEKHFTLDKSLPGPDQKASLSPEEFEHMVKVIRDAQASLGEEEKEPQTSEKENIDVARKSLFASRSITAGERFSSENIEIKRPGTGISPMRYWDLLGTVARRSIPKGSPIDG